MARYELDTQFREVVRDGATITTREGTLGAPASEHVAEHATVLVARYHAIDYVRALVAAGYQRVDTPARRELVPDDDAARLVHADVLQLRGDPRGELVVMQARGVDATALIDANAEAWFGDLALGWQYLDATWRLGWLQRVTLSPWAIFHSLMPEIRPWHVLPVVLDALFELPIAHALEELAIVDLEDRFAQMTVDAILAAPPTLRVLELGCQIDRMMLHTIASAAWPSLETLAIAIGHGAVSTLTPVLMRQRIPTLKRLIVTTPEPAELARAAKLARSDHDLVIR